MIFMMISLSEENIGDGRVARVANLNLTHLAQMQNLHFYPNEKRLKPIFIHLLSLHVGDCLSRKLIRHSEVV
jgi:hypothetical protein